MVFWTNSGDISSTPNSPNSAVNRHIFFQSSTTQQKKEAHGFSQFPVKTVQDIDVYTSTPNGEAIEPEIIRENPLESSQVHLQVFLTWASPPASILDSQQKYRQSPLPLKRKRNSILKTKSEPTALVPGLPVVVQDFHHNFVENWIHGLYPELQFRDSQQIKQNIARKISPSLLLTDRSRHTTSRIQYQIQEMLALRFLSRAPAELIVVCAKINLQLGCPSPRNIAGKDIRRSPDLVPYRNKLTNQVIFVNRVSVLAAQAASIKDTPHTLVVRCSNNNAYKLSISMVTQSNCLDNTITDGIGKGVEIPTKGLGLLV